MYINNNAENNFEGEEFFLLSMGVSEETLNHEEDIFLPSLVSDRSGSLISNMSYSSDTDLDSSLTSFSSSNVTSTPNRWTTSRSLNNNNDTIFFENSIDSISSQFYSGSYADTVCLDNVRTVPERIGTRPRRNAISHISAAELSQLFN